MNGKLKMQLPENTHILTKKVSLDKVWNYISNPDNIMKHGFYPFIHYEKKFNKFTKKDGMGYIKEKSRHLCYSAHIDRYIYSYYGYLLNQKYINIWKNVIWIWLQLHIEIICIKVIFTLQKDF